MSKKTICIIVLIISALTLQLELLQTRILSVALWFHFVYMVITMALLGFAASGTALSIWSGLRKLSDTDFFFLCLVGFSLTSYASSKFAIYPIRNTFSLSPDLKLVFNLIIAYTILMLPYFFSGLAIGGSFTRFPNATSVLYFANLLGSGLGCILFIYLIGPLEAPLLLVFSSLVCIIPLISFLKKKLIYKVIFFPWLLFLIIALLLPANCKLHQILPESHKQFWTLLPKSKLEYTEWNPISRIDVISNAELPREKYILMDGDAQAMLYDIEVIKRNLLNIRWRDRHAAYVLLDKRPEDVLVIGAGGGFDVLWAVVDGALKIDAVEINPTTAKLISHTYAEHVNHIFSDPHVRLFVEDGRSFVKRTQKQYDVIMMCATDSSLALSTGAYILADNYLYTEEALVDYLDHLSDDGLIQIGRFFYYQKPRETLRVFATALEACKDKKYDNPVAHIIVISPHRNWADVIIKKKVFTNDEIERLKLYCAETNIKIIFLPSMLREPTEDRSAFLELADNFSKGTEGAFYNAYDYNVYPVHDDSPFFYQYNKWHSKTSKNFVHTYYDRLRGVWHIFILSSLLAHSIILSVILVLLPLVIAKKNIGKLKNRFFVFIYFMSIGFGFMLLEMSIVQKFVLFLGSPIYSMAITIPAILIFAGIGSLFSGRIKGNSILYACVVTFICSMFIFLLLYLMPVITNLFLMQPLSTRICAVILTIAPLAFCMGLPFPLVLRSLSHQSQELMPWAWAINGASSVIASIIAIIIAMQCGFKIVLSISAGFYLVSSVTALLYWKRLTVD
jgi:hypothetical protein